MHADSIREAARRLRAVEAEVRILRGIDWDPGVKERFLDRGGRELPEVEYASFDAGPLHAGLREALEPVGGDGPIADWLRRSARAIGTAADLLAARGTPAFLEHGTRLFGRPDEVRFGLSPLELARTVDGLCDELSGIDLGAPPPACHLAAGVAQRMREASTQLFGTEAPEVQVVESMSANAIAGPRRILVRRDACFTDRDVLQLVQHEAYVHVCTSLNGKHQPDLPLLAASHAGTTRTQEGLAVFAEFITASLDPDRLRRLADRVLAIQMSIDGADFLDVYRFFRGRALPEDQAYENARRVFRGGVLTGGAPFLKDAVYLGGFLDVTSFLRSVVAEGRADLLPLLFCGKLDLEDVPALALLSEMGLCAPPRYLPPWASDRRFLVTYLSYSQFLSSVRQDAQRTHSHELLAAAPVAKTMQAS